MSKAFTKEQDGESPGADDSDEREGVQLPGGSKNYMTPSGFARLREELQDLLNVKRPEVVRTVAWAASNGDRSENADYIYGKRRLREIDRRIRFLQRRLDAAEVVDPARQSSDRVLFGATVTVCEESGGRKTYSIVGIDETDAKRGYISWISPMAKALLNAQAGDVVSVRTPRGEQELEIERIEYKALS